MFFATSIAEKCDVGTFSQLIKETIGGDWGQEQPKGNYTSKVTCIRGTDIPALNLGSISAAPTRYILPKNLSSKRITADKIMVSCHKIHSGIRNSRKQIIHFLKFSHKRLTVEPISGYK